ncbi:MAG: hypothetical protein M1826_005638 [Phylliscum demangeonii]|nr:MAG: hypothetical protein M1826_005638 [Phylliscum demangeonii]
MSFYMLFPWVVDDAFDNIIHNVETAVVQLLLSSTRQKTEGLARGVDKEKTNQREADMKDTDVKDTDKKDTDKDADKKATEKKEAVVRNPYATGCYARLQIQEPLECIINQFGRMASNVHGWAQRAKKMEVRDAACGRYRYIFETTKPRKLRKILTGFLADIDRIDADYCASFHELTQYFIKSEQTIARLSALLDHVLFPSPASEKHIVNVLQPARDPFAHVIPPLRTIPADTPTWKVVLERHGLPNLDCDADTRLVLVRAVRSLSRATLQVRACRAAAETEGGRASAQMPVWQGWQRIRLACDEEQRRQAEQAAGGEGDGEDDGEEEMVEDGRHQQPEGFPVTLPQGISPMPPSFF